MNYVSNSGIIDNAKYDFYKGRDFNDFKAVIDILFCRAFCEYELEIDPEKVLLKFPNYDYLIGKTENFIAACFDDEFLDCLDSGDEETMTKHFEYWFGLDPYSEDLNSIRVVGSTLNKEEI